MKQMKAYILHLGDMWSDSNYSVMGDTSATVSNPTAPNRLQHTPDYAVLIDHPEAGWILYDTGMSNDPETDWPEGMKAAVKISKPESTRMEYQLGLVGIRPEDVKHVITSHMHMDHVGNDKLFADTAEFYVAREEASHAYRTVLQSPSAADHGYYIKEDILLTRKRVTYIDEDEELFPGVEVIQLPGHTPCILGLVLHLLGGTIIFTSDASNEARNYSGLLPGAVFDSIGYLESLKKIKKLQNQYYGTVLFSHDGVQFSELKKAPEYYS